MVGGGGRGRKRGDDVCEEKQCVVWLSVQAMDNHTSDIHTMGVHLSDSMTDEETLLWFAVKIHIGVIFLFMFLQFALEYRERMLEALAKEKWELLYESSSSEKVTAPSRKRSSTLPESEPFSPASLIN